MNSNDAGRAIPVGVRPSGCPFWLGWVKKHFDPRKEVKAFTDLLKFPHFQDESLRDLQPEVWVPSKFKGRPFNIFETGGTTGMPKQRIGWDDYKVDYEEFSGKDRKSTRLNS